MGSIICLSVIFVKINVWLSFNSPVFKQQVNSRYLQKLRMEIKYIYICILINSVRYIMFQYPIVVILVNTHIFLPLACENFFKGAYDASPVISDSIFTFMYGKIFCTFPRHTVCL